MVCCRLLLVAPIALFPAFLGLTGCAQTQEKPEIVSYQPRPVSFSPATARDWLTQYRQSKGLTAVVLDPKLTAFAQAQADAMAAHEELSHSVGGEFSARVRSAGLADARIAENVSYGTYTETDAMRQWKNSSAHNENLLMAGAVRFGIAYAQTKRRVYWAMAIAGEARAQAVTAAGLVPAGTVLAGTGHSQER